MLGDQYQSLHRGLPFLGIMFGLGQLGDVERCVASGPELLGARFGAEFRVRSGRC